MPQLSVPARMRRPTLVQFATLAIAHPLCRPVAVYICAKSALMLLQFMGGVALGQPQHVSGSFHTGFDVMALGISLYAIVMSKTRVIDYSATYTHVSYSYGYGRAETLAAFTSTIFLFFVSIFLCIEMFHTLWAAPDIATSDVVFCALGLAIDAAALAIMWRHASLQRIDSESNAAQVSLIQSQEKAESKPLSAHSSDGAHLCNMHSVFLHAYADCVGHVSYLVASFIHAKPDAAAAAVPLGLFAQINQMMQSNAHTISYGVTAVLVARASWPLFRYTSSLLLQTTDMSIKTQLDRCVREISFFDGVLECRSVHWWQMAPRHTVGSLTLRIRYDASEADIRRYCESILVKKGLVKDLTLQLDKDVPFNPSSNQWLQRQ